MRRVPGRRQPCKCGCCADFPSIDFCVGPPFLLSPLSPSFPPVFCVRMGNTGGVALPYTAGEEAFPAYKARSLCGWTVSNGTSNKDKCVCVTMRQSYALAGHRRGCIGLFNAWPALAIALLCVSPSTLRQSLYVFYFCLWGCIGGLPHHRGRCLMCQPFLNSASVHRFLAAAAVFYGIYFMCYIRRPVRVSTRAPAAVS